MKHIKTYITLSLFYGNAPILCMQQQKAQNYITECKTINEEYQSRWKKLIKSTTEDNAAEKMEQSQKELQLHRKRISNEKKIVLFTLKTRYQIHDKVWDTALQIVSELKKYNKKTRLSLSGGAVHDPKIPGWFLAMLKSELVKSGHNPASINLFVTENGCEQTKNGIIQYSLSEGVLSIERKDYGSIGISCFDLKHNYADIFFQKGRYFRLIKWMQKLGIRAIYGALKSLVVDDIPPVSIPEKEFTVLNAFDQKKSLYEIALEDKQGAECIKKWHNQVWSEDIEVEDYRRFSDICFHWQSYSWLKKYFSNNYHCIPLALKVKCGDITAVTNLLKSGMVVTQHMIDDEKHDESEVKKLLQEAHKAQRCCICFEHPEDMRDVPCVQRHTGDFMCRKCYKDLDIQQSGCPICKRALSSYNSAR